MRTLGSLFVVSSLVACSSPSDDNPFDPTISSVEGSGDDDDDDDDDDDGSGSDSDTGSSSDDGADTNPTMTTMPADSSEGDSSSSGDESTTSDEPAVCGDGMISGDEVCDGTEFGDADCVTQGFGGGELVCNPTCQGFSTAECFICGDGMVQGTEQCDGAVPGGVTCDSEGFTDGEITCDVATCQFDTSGCSLCGNGVAELNESCDGDDLLGETCATLGFDGGDLDCNDTSCAFEFSACEGTNLSCAETFVGNVVPQSVEGSLVGEDEDYAQSCGFGGSVDHLVAFIAPNDGTFRFDAIGSDYDTVLSVHMDCDGAELGCNDDFAGNPDCGTYPCSQLDLALVSGQAVVIAMSGYNMATGNFVLNITEP
jgi:hypothetical protein